jgi:hypothetical protein
MKARQNLVKTSLKTPYAQSKKTSRRCGRERKKPRKYVKHRTHFMSQISLQGNTSVLKQL